MDGFLHVGIQVNGINEQRLGMGSGDVAKGGAKFLEGPAEIFPAMTSDEDHRPARCGFPLPRIVNDFTGIGLLP